MKLKHKIILCEGDREICKIGDKIKINLSTEESIIGIYDGLYENRVHINRQFKDWAFSGDGIESIEVLNGGGINNDKI